MDGQQILCGDSCTAALYVQGFAVRWRLFCWSSGVRRSARF